MFPERTRLLDRLMECQRRSGYVRDEDIKACAQWLGISEIEVEGVASFYHFLHRKPAGDIIIYLDTSIIADYAGYRQILKAFEDATGAKLGGTSPCGLFGLYPTACIGLSDQSPAALMNFHPFTRLTPEKVTRVIRDLRLGVPLSELADAVEPNIRYLPPDNKTVFFRPFDPGNALKAARGLRAEGVINALKQSELSGRGGAYFPTWIKWDACRKQTSDAKFVVCNADEGEPGTFKDRVLLQECPETVVEGMLVAAYAVGASFGFIYLRGEYRWLLPKLENTLQQYRSLGLLGQNAGGIEGFHFDVHVQLGAGAYVCGEETAMLESMEGKRGEPRTKWFFPVERGFLQKPTLINNVETFAAAAHIVENGADWWRQRGIEGSPGTKLISVSGDCQKPGLYEIEWGMPVSELLGHCEARDPYYIQVSGPSGECISMEEKDRRISMIDLLDRQDIRCGGSFMVFNRERDLINILLNFSAFFKHESCGICTPCRAGNFILQRQLEKIGRGLAQTADLDSTRQWGAIMKQASRCGLGKTAANSAIMAMEKFRADFDARLSHDATDLNRAFDMEKAVAEYEKFKPVNP